MDAAYPILTSALASFVLAKLLVLTADHHGRFSMDLPGAIQKFHIAPTPRVGGVSIYLALLGARLLLGSSETARILDIILVAGIPALVIGLLEDLTKRVGILARLAATMASGAIACWASGIVVLHVDLPFIDAALKFGPVALLFTAFAVGGVANAINIIDGFNGLASGTTVIALAGLALISAIVGDVPLVLAAVILAGAVAGFWLVNFPWGKLFLGDGGAYFAGFALAWLAVLLPVRNPAVSPWASLLLCAYPIVEVLYSVVRRRTNRASASQADRAHLHSLIATRIVQHRLARWDPALQNSAVSVLMWMCAAFPALLGVTFHARTSWLIASAAACLLLYHWLYRWVARI